MMSYSIRCIYVKMTKLHWEVSECLTLDNGNVSIAIQEPNLSEKDRQYSIKTHNNISSFLRAPRADNVCSLLLLTHSAVAKVV